MIEQKDKFDIMVKSKSSQDQIASYLVQAVLGLRDRMNKNESVRLFGVGSAIPNVILVAEIIRARYKGLSSIVSLEKVNKEIKEENRTITIPAIRIKLTCKPTQEEQQQAGYQAPEDVQEDKNFDLFDYVMIYAKNLFFWKNKHSQRQNNNNSSNKHAIQSNEKSEKTYQSKEESERGSLQSRGGINQSRFQQNYKRKEDEPEQQQQNSKETNREQQRNTRNSRPIPRPIQAYDQTKQNQTQKEQGQLKTKQGEIRTRGGNRK